MVRRSLGQLGEEVQAIEDSSTGARERVTQVDLENVRLIEHIHQMTSEIASLKQEIQIKEKQSEEKEVAYEDGVLLENSYKAEISRLHGEIERIASEKRRVQVEMESRNDVETTKEVGHTLQKNGYESRLRQITAELNEKKQQLVATEDALTEACSSLERNAVECDGKLNTAFEIAASLRQLLEAKEEQYRELQQRSGPTHMKQGGFPTGATYGNTHEAALDPPITYGNTHEAALDPPIVYAAPKRESHISGVESMMIQTEDPFDKVKGLIQESLHDMNLSNAIHLPRFNEDNMGISLEEEVPQEKSLQEDAPQEIGLHSEIQRLQNKIMKRLEEPPTFSHEIKAPQSPALCEEEVLMAPLSTRQVEVPHLNEEMLVSTHSAKAMTSSVSELIASARAATTKFSRKNSEAQAQLTTSKAVIGHPRNSDTKHSEIIEPKLDLNLQDLKERVSAFQLKLA